MAVTEKDVRNALKGVKDPELGLDLIVLGLIYDLEIEGSSVHATMSLTSPFCPVAGQIVEDARQAILDATDGGADVVVDVTAYATSPVADALDYVKPGGTIVLAGVKGFVPIPDFVSDKIVIKEVAIRGAIGVTTTGYAEAIRVIESGRIPVERMHTHDFRLRDAEEAILTLAGRGSGARSIHSCLLPTLG